MKFLSILAGRGTLSEINEFLNSEFYDSNDSEDNILNSFDEWIVENTDYDMEQEYKLSYGKQFPKNQKFTGV